MSFRFHFSALFLASSLLLIGLSPTGYIGVPQSNTGAALPFVISDEPSLATYTTRDGLAGDLVTSLAVAKDGAVWVGTTMGATRIEQARWTTFTHVHGLGDDWITAIAIAPDQRIWVGTQSGGISVFDGNKFTTFTISNSALPSNFVTAVAIDSRGTVWIGTLSAGVASFDPAVNRWTRYRLADNSVTALALDSQDLPWVGTDGGGAFRFDGKLWTGAAVPGSGQVKRIESDPGQGIVITTNDGRFKFDGKTWVKAVPLALLEQTARALSLDADQIGELAGDGRGHIYVATPRGLSVWTTSPAQALEPPRPLPVVLVHGWTVSASDEIQDSEFRFLKQYAEDDGLRVFYARGISPKNTLFQNAERLRDDIAAVKKTTGADKVNLLAFSMGGLNARAYLESSLYQNDVNRVIILGTPEAGVDIWKPILAEQIIQKPDQPSAIELSPEYSRLFNQAHAPRASLPYDLLIGDARNQPLLDFIADLPPNDGLIGVASALSLVGSNVRHAVDDDLHAYDPTATPFHLTSYLYPRDTYDRYLRNALRDPTNAPLGSEVETLSLPLQNGEQVGVERQTGEGNHTPVFTAPLASGETVTRTVTLDVNRHARFLAYFPGGDVDLTLTAPDGKVYSSTVGSIVQEASGTANGGAIGLKADIASFVGYSFAPAVPGKWSLGLKRTDKGAEALDVTTYVDLDADQRLNAGVNRASVRLGESVTITATLSARVPDVKMTARIAIPAPKLGDPFTFVDLPLLDHQDGLFLNTFTPPRGGYYLVFVNASGAGFARGGEFVFAVNPGGATLQPAPAAHIERDSSGQIKSITFDVAIEVQRAGKYALGANLRGVDGQIAARVAVPVDVSQGAGRAAISFDARDLISPGPYTLDLVLLDTSWAALEIDGAEDVATVQP